MNSAAPAGSCCLCQPRERLEVSVLPLWQVCPWRFPGARPFPAPQSRGSCRRSERGAHQHLTSCVQANLSFFFHYLGMYCHLIFMYAILPDKYDLLPGNSSDVHSVPCSNYGSVPGAAADTAEPLLHLSAGSGLPDALSCQSAASKYNQREK